MYPHSVQSGDRLVQAGLSDRARADLTPRGTRHSERVDMVDSYMTGIASTRVTSIDYMGPDVGRRLSLTASFGGDKTTFPPPTHENGTVIMQVQKHEITAVTSIIPETPPDIPGISIITWEEFVEEPSLFHQLFSIDKNEFISFDNTIVSNFFHDSRMETPTLGGPSGDGMSWTIFVDNYSQLRQLRDTLTSRISVLLLDLVKPDNGGTAACLVAINPNDERIRRVLHLTLSRAMESLFADRCFCVEIDLNNSVEEWCKTVLQLNCTVFGGQLIITNGDASVDCCEVENPVTCVLCFPMWAFRKLRYLIQRRRRYDDTKVEFESSSIVLCSKSDSLRQYSESVQSTNGERIIRKNKCAVTMATQTLNTSTVSFQSEMSIEEMEEAEDNDVRKRRDVADDERGSFGSRGFDNPTFEDERDVEEMHMQSQHYPPSPGLQTSGKQEFWPGGSEDEVADQRPGAKRAVTNGENKKKTVMFHNDLDNDYLPCEDEMFDSELDAVAMANATTSSTHSSTSGLHDEEPDQVPSPRKQFLLRPDTPFQNFPKPSRKACAERSLDRHVSTHTNEEPMILAGPDAKLAQSETSSKSDGINEKIATRQKKIGELLKDLIGSSSGGAGGPSKIQTELEDSGKQEIFDHERKEPKRSKFFAMEEEKVKGPSKKTKQTPIQNWSCEQDTVFPYTSDLLDFSKTKIATREETLERYGAKKKKGKSKKQDMLFHPRLNFDAFGPERNCFSDQDIADSDITDLETEPENAVSDTEGITSSRLIPVTSTDRTLSMNSVTPANITNNVSDADTDLEITDCEAEEQELSKKIRAPRVLCGALAAQELRASSAKHISARSRDYIPPSDHARRRGGNQNDSRRRYLALNSLRRKAYKLALQSQVRNQERPQSASLLSYNVKNSGVTIMSQV